MKYLFSDYDLLRSVTLRRDRSISFSMMRHEFTLNHGNLITPACMMHALRGLASGGYITVEAPDGVINGSDPVVCLTEKGRAMRAEVNGKDAIQNELDFCALDRPDVTVGKDWMPDFPYPDACYCNGFFEESLQYPTFTVTELDNGGFRLTVHHHEDLHEYPIDPDEALYSFETSPEKRSSTPTYSVSVEGTGEQILRFFTDLLDATLLLIDDPLRPRNVSICGTDASLLLSLTTKLLPRKVNPRITVKVHSGEISAERADGALHVFRTDSTVLSFSMENAFTFCYNCVLRSAAACPHLLTEEHFEKVSALHRRVLPHVQKRSL